MTITTYDPDTGEIKSIRTGQSMEELLSQIGETPFIEGAHSPLFFEIDLDTQNVTEKQ